MTTPAPRPAGPWHRRLLGLLVLALGAAGVLVAHQGPVDVARWATPAPAASRAAVTGTGAVAVPGAATVAAPDTAIPARPVRLREAKKPRAVATTLPSLAAVRTVAAGLVDIDTVLDGGRARGAGTGIVLTSDGTVLTNHHVVAGASRIAVTDLGNGRTYRGVVVGDAPGSDVAVVRMVGATGLRVAPLATGSDLRVGAAVVGIGNAGGIGTPSASPGVVTALNRRITAQDQGPGGARETLTGMIATTAGLRPGDSGGALVDGSGRVVGLDTAAASDASSGFAIPIARAVAVARQIA